MGKIAGYEDKFGLKRKTLFTFTQFTAFAAKATAVRFVVGRVFY